MLVCVWITRSGGSIKSFTICPAFSSPLPHLAMKIPSLLEGTSMGALTGWSARWKGTRRGLYAGDIREEGCDPSEWQFLTARVSTSLALLKLPSPNKREFSIVERGRNAPRIPLFHDFIPAQALQASSGRRESGAEQQGGGSGGRRGLPGWRAELESNAFSPRSKQLETWGNFSPPLLSGSQDTEFSF